MRSGIQHLASFAVAVFVLECQAGEWCLAVDGSMEANGWRESRAQRQDSFTVKDGVLTAVCSPNPYKGALYSRDIELPEIP